MPLYLWPYAFIIDVTYIHCLFTLILGVFHKMVIWNILLGSRIILWRPSPSVVILSHLPRAYMLIQTFNNTHTLSLYVKTYTKTYTYIYTLALYIYIYSYEALIFISCLESRYWIPNYWASNVHTWFRSNLDFACVPTQVGTKWLNSRR